MKLAFLQLNQRVFLQSRLITLVAGCLTIWELEKTSYFTYLGKIKETPMTFAKNQGNQGIL